MVRSNMRSTLFWALCPLRYGYDVGYGIAAEVNADELLGIGASNQRADHDLSLHQALPDLHQQLEQCLGIEV